MDKILIINSGSATLKFKIYSLPKLESELVGIIERIGLDQSFIEIRVGAKKSGVKAKKDKVAKGYLRRSFPAGLKNHSEAFEAMVKELKNYLSDIKYVGHRVVHGGEKFVSTTQLNFTVLEQLKKYNDLAPLHNPINLLCAKKSLELLPEAKQFAIFDTAYYSTMPDYAYLYALPKKFAQEYGIRRYGFHGISHKYAAIEGAKQLKQPLKKLKIITCHLGSGASITATKFGEAVDTTMGFTPLEGLTMSTRVGDLDASVPLFMVEKLGLSTNEVYNILNKESGLLAISGTTDMREILAAAGQKVAGYEVKKKFTDEEKRQSTLALKMFVYDIVRYIGQFTAIMKGVDLLVFTGGIGERSPVIRQLVLKDVRPLGKFKAVVVEADEELMMAKEIITCNP